MAVTIEQIKELRGRTGAGVNAVKEALEQANGDLEKAIEFLREKGIAKANKRAGKEATNGILGTYIHPDNRLVAIVEIACETDFAAKSDAMKEFAKNIALHIAAVGSEYLNVEDIPAEVLEKEKALYQKDVEGKPAEIAEKILDGKLRKFYEQTVLTYQPYFKDESKTIQDYMNEMVAQIGEKMRFSRFVRLQIAKPTNSCNLY
jgi:elongation factor Ts